MRTRARLLLPVLAALAAVVFSSAQGLADVPSWTTYHLNNHRDGANTTEPAVSLSTTPAWKATLDGMVYAEPLVLGNEVFVATENDTVYSLDIRTGAVNWSQQVSTPATATEQLFPVAGSALGGCGDIFPLGVTSTPVLDAASHRLMLVAAAWDGKTADSIHHYFWALDTAARGAPLVAGVSVDPPASAGFTPHDQQQRAALALAAGHVYFAYGGLSGDCFTYNGWVARVEEDGTGFQATNVTVAAGIGGRGGIWASSGPAVDDSGNLYVATGNGNQTDSTQPSDLTDSVVKLSPALAVLDHFTPVGWGPENRDDLDLGSSGPLLLSGGLVYQAGKTGGYLLDANSLGGGNDKGGELFFSSMCHGFGGNAYSAATDVVYAACTDGVRALQVHRANSGGCSTLTNPCFSEIWHGPSDASGPPILAGGKVWVRGRTFGSNDPSAEDAPTTLYGLNPGTGTIETLVENINGVVHFGTPTMANGTLLLAEGPSVVAFDRPVTSGWYPLGGSVSGRTAVATNGDGRLEGFGRASDGSLQHAWQSSPGGGWTGWYSLGGNLAGDPMVTTNRDGRLEAFAVGVDGRLWHAWQVAPSSGWTGWYPLGGNLSGRPALVVNGDGRLEAFARGADGAVWHVWQTSPGGGWSAVYSLGASGIGDPAAGTNADGRAEVFGRAQDNSLEHAWQVVPGGGWSSWYSLGGSTSGAPALGQNTDGRFEVFARVAGNGISHTWQTTPGGGWYPLTSLGGNFTTDPVVTRNTDGRLIAFGVDSGGLVAHADQTAVNGGWAPWLGLVGFAAGAQPGVGRNRDGRLELLARGTDSSVWHDWQKMPGGDW